MSLMWIFQRIQRYRSLCPVPINNEGKALEYNIMSVFTRGTGHHVDLVPYSSLLTYCHSLVEGTCTTGYSACVVMKTFLSVI